MSLKYTLYNISIVSWTCDQNCQLSVKHINSDRITLYMVHSPFNWTCLVVIFNLYLAKFNISYFSHNNVNIYLSLWQIEILP